MQEGLKDFDGGIGDILLITDGIETCDADPCALMEQWKTLEVGIRVHVVGVGLNTVEKVAISCIASISGGRYFDADSADHFTEALTEVRQVVVEPTEPEVQIAEAPKPKKQLKSTANEPEAPKKPKVSTYILRLLGRDSQGREYVIAGTLQKHGAEMRDVRSDKRNIVDGPGDYAVQVGPVLADGTTYNPVKHSFKVDEFEAVTDVVVLVERPAIVTADFIEDEKPHPGKRVTVYRDGKELFGFQPGGTGNRREVLMRPGAYEFRSEPNPDNKLSIKGSIDAGETTELLFELLTTLKVHISFKLPNGDIIKRHSGLWRDGGLAYKAHSRNGVLARPGTYEIRSDDILLPAIPTEVTLSENNQKIEVPIDAGYILISYPDTPENYLAKPNRAWIYPSIKTESVFARPGKAIPVTPGNYRVEPYAAAGYFDPVKPFDISSGETVKVLLTPKPLGAIVVTYATSDDYPQRPDRAVASVLGSQELKNGFMRPSRPLKVLPGRYRITGRSGFDMKPKDIEVRAGETTEVLMKLVTAE